MAREYNEQKTLFKWALQPHIRAKYPELMLMYHIKNEERGATAQSVAIDRASGVKKGVPDICLPAARGKWHGMYIEMKAEKGRLQQEQEWWLLKLWEQGYFAICCHGWKEAAAKIEAYLKGEVEK